MTPNRVILDVDTGHDDAVAILMAAADPCIILEGITVVAGNQTLDKTVRNTLNVCSALSIEVPVFCGMPKPLIRPHQGAPLIHGESGLDGPVFSSCSRLPEKIHAVQFIIKTILENQPQTVSLVAVAPLTNIAIALTLEPSIATRLKEIVIMGGSSGYGNVTLSAEFNIHADPESASIVFSSGARIVMLALDITTTIVLTPERLAYFASIPGKAAFLFSASMSSYLQSCSSYLGEFPAMHDPCAVAWAADSSLFSGIECYVEIELHGTHTSGRTIIDFQGRSGKPPNAFFVQGIREQGFWDMLERALRKWSNRR